MGRDRQRYESWTARQPDENPLIFAATAILLRDTGSSGDGDELPENAISDQPTLQVLMVKRASQLSFGGGSWVFPGGRVDASDAPDLPAGQNMPDNLMPDNLDICAPIEEPDSSLWRDSLPAACHAAVRETLEETGLRISATDLVPFSRWVPPAIAPKRFATWFFLASAQAGQAVKVDGGEITDHAWMSPAQVLHMRERKEMDMLPPTFVSLLELSAQTSTAQAMAFAKDRLSISLDDPIGDPADDAPDGPFSNPLRTPLFATKIATLEDKAVSLWEGDAGYETGDATLTGNRHRLVMADDSWDYQREIL